MKLQKEKNNLPIKEVPFEEAEYSVFDFETTGISARNDKVIEIGIVKVHKGKIVDTFQSYINPGRQIPYHITLLTGITNEDVAGAPYFEDLIDQIKNFFGNSVLVAHNLSFDLSFLKHECLNLNLEPPANPALCTLKIARKIYPHLPSKSLGHIVRSLKIRHRNVHRGLGDAAATAKVLLRMFKNLRNEHGIETVSDLINFQSTPGSAQYKLIKKKLYQDLVKAPEEPGIYFFKNAKGETIYIGKAKSLKQRIGNYFVNNVPRKSKEIVRKAQSIGFYTTNTELTALLAEAEFIKEANPILNKLLKKYGRNYFIKVALAKNVPDVSVVTDFYFDGNDYYGPYPNRDTASAIKEIIDKTFLLRECTDKEFSKKRKCYLADIERCLAPCVEQNTDAYNDELSKVKEFLCGQNQSAVNRLLNRMKKLSLQQKYEEAARVRDVVNEVLKQLNKASILSVAVNNANVLIEIKGVRHNDYICLLEGRVFIRNFLKEKSNSIEEALENYFAGTIRLFRELTEKDLERLKITLSWLVKNREQIRIHSLCNYNSIEELGTNLIFHKDEREAVRNESNQLIYEEINQQQAD